MRWCALRLAATRIVDATEGCRRTCGARGAHWDERVRMMQWWADYLDQLKATGEVVPFRVAVSGAAQ
jgi:hypothetical protein